MATLLYFASLREALDCETEQLSIDSSPATVGQLKRQLAERGGRWSEAFDQGRLLASVNQRMAADDTAVSDSDEIAFFPPVTGG